jgi:hypothetical protein
MRKRLVGECQLDKFSARHRLAPIPAPLRDDSHSLLIENGPYGLAVPMITVQGEVVEGEQLADQRQIPSQEFFVLPG